MILLHVQTSWHKTEKELYKEIKKLSVWILNFLWIGLILFCNVNLGGFWLTTIMLCTKWRVNALYMNMKISNIYYILDSFYPRIPYINVYIYNWTASIDEWNAYSNYKYIHNLYCLRRPSIGIRQNDKIQCTLTSSLDGARANS